MLNCSICGGIRKLSDRVKDIFSGRLASYSNSCAIFSFFLLGCMSLCELVRRCPWSHSVSDLSRAVEGFEGNRFMRRLRNSILRHYKGALNPNDFCFAIDDTDNPKYGKTVFRRGLWHGSKGKYLGQKVCVVVLVDIERGFALPLSYAFIPKKTDPDYRSGLDLGLEMFAQILAAGFPRLPVAADSWFDGVNFIKGLRKLDLHYCGEIKGNRLVKPVPSPKVRWRHLPKLFSGKQRQRLRNRLESAKVKKRKRKAKCGSVSRLVIKEYRSMLVGLAVYNTKRCKDAFAYYVSTDLSMTGARLWEISRARWKIECMFRDLKQNLSFGRLPSGGKEAADLAVCVPMMLYTSLRLDPTEYWGLKKRESIGTMVGKIRERELMRSINLITSNPGHAKVIRLRERRHQRRINRKPVNSNAGRLANA